jgi:nicotinamidase-related amidase
MIYPPRTITEESMLSTRKGRHTSILQPDSSLLVVVDMQEPFLQNIWERERLVKNVTILLDAARLLRVPIVPTQQNTDRIGNSIPEVTKRLPSQSVPFDKLCFSCAGDGAFMSELQRSGKKQIVLCGVETHICISQTGLDLLAHGYQVQVVADAVSSRTQNNWQLGLNKLERAGAVLTSTESAVYELLGEAGTPEFREMLALLK